MDAPSLFGHLKRRTNFLSTGVTLCSIVAAICAAPLAFVVPWIAMWLLSLMTLIVLGTFGIWAFHAVKNPRLLDSEEHTEQMGVISVYGKNSLIDEPRTISIDPAIASENPRIQQQGQIVDSSEDSDD
jgi:hypothetical protein